jgi:outer membrane protein assembly factor BamA
MRSRSAFILTFILIITAGCLANTRFDYLKPYAGKTIMKIDIVRKNVFDDLIANNDNSPFYYRWANDLHVMTRESVVRRELLFNVGDKLNPEKVIETERNLRLEGFIGEVEIRAVEDGADGVDLTVTTSDLWTTKVSLYADLAGGKYDMGLDLTEENLMGLGKTIDILGQVGNDENGYRAYYADNRLLSTRLALGLNISDFTYENGFLISLNRPRYSVFVPTSFTAVYSHYRIRPRLFSGGEEFFKYRDNKTVASLNGTYSFGRFKHLGLIGGYNYENHDYSPDQLNSIFNFLIPADEKLSYPLIGVSGGIIQYDVERYLDAPGTAEDLTLGAGFRATLGRSDRIFGATYGGYNPSFTAQFLAKSSSRAFVGAIDNISWWFHDNRNERFRHISEAAFYYKPLTTHVLELHALTDFSWRQRSNYQIFLGGGNGLRGHSFYELAGTKLAVGNIEYRFYLPVEILTVRLGGAAFFDIGNVWDRDDHLRFPDLQSDVGIGLRLGMTRASTSRVINLDFARALSRNRYYVTFTSSTSLFRLANLNINE